MDDLDKLTIGLITDMHIESLNDQIHDEESEDEATQADFDRFRMGAR